MNYKIIGLLIMIILGLTSCTTQVSNMSNDTMINEIYENYPELQDHAYTLETVKRVVDGDTFETIEGSRVRLIGANTPETVKPNSPVEFYGKEASRYSKDRLDGKRIYMFEDAGDVDRYGRKLRYVFLENDPHMVNEMLITEGYANVMTVPPNVMYADKFVKAERQARSTKSGLWADGETKQKLDEEQSKSVSKKPAEPLLLATCKDNEFVVKGNINAKGEKIYHLPGGRYYTQTKAEQLFCNEKAATEAGFRKSKQ